VNVSSIQLTDWLTAIAQGREPLTLPTKSERSFQQAIESTANKSVITKLKLASDQGGTLPPGPYLITITSPQLTAAYPQYKLEQVLVVGTANLTLKTSPNEALVWATDLKTGQPIPNAPITLYRMATFLGFNGFSPIASGTTDASGLYRAAIPNDPNA